MILTRREGIAALAAVVTGGLKSSRPQTVAFRYSASFTPQELQWCTRFRILVTGGILSPATTHALQRNGTRLIAYEWSSAFYPGDHVSAAPDWQSAVIGKRRDWLLNAAPVSGGAAEGQRAAEWYDFANSSLLAERAAHLAGLVKAHGYSGLFLDTLGFSQLPAPLRDEYRRRHPHIDYEEMQGQFLKLLKTELGPDSLLFTNQGYRNAAVYLPWADLDLSESYFTFVRPGGGTDFRRWRDAHSPWNSIAVPMEKLVAPAASRFPHVQFVHLNYAEGDAATVRRAILFSQACARLWDQSAYLVAPGAPAAEHDDVYFEDLGAPVHPVYQEDRNAGIAWRSFSKGVVAVNAGTRPGRIASLGLDLPDAPAGYIFRR